MAKAAGLSRPAVISEAARMVDEVGPGGLTLTALAARLGVRTPSLYAHVGGIDGLMRDLALVGVRELGEQLRASVLGKAGREALVAVANAYRQYAQEHSGLYSVTIRDPGDDEELRSANARCAEALTAVLESFGARGDEVIHLYRALWSAVHGFVTLEASGVLSLPVAVDDSFDRMIDMFELSLEQRAFTAPTRPRKQPRVRART
jgi:AcrR family transcriptional regulator